MRTVAFCIALLFAASAAAQVYKWKDADGVVHYGDRAPRDAAAETVAIEPPPPGAGMASTAPATPPAAGTPAPRSDAAPQSIDIVMYSRPDCGYCARARSYFAQRNIPYRELDVSRSAQARAEWRRLGGTGVPLFVINGNVSRGFSADGMTSRLRSYGW